MVRALSVLLGALLSIAGAPIAVVVPEVGVPLLVAGLSLLALEFEWAVEALTWVIRTWERLKRWYRGLSSVGKLCFRAVAIALLVGLFWLLPH